MIGYVYVLTSPATSLLKIGKTTRDPIVRAQELSGNTGVPFPFEVAYSVYVNDCASLERCVHERLADRRASAKREFFDVTLAQAIAAIEEFLIDINAGRQAAQSDAAASGKSGIPEPGTSLRTNTPRELSRDVKESSPKAAFDPLAFARERMIESAQARIALFKTIFKRAADVYRIVSSLEGQPMRSGKRYPPFSFSITKERDEIYISCLHISDITKEAIYGTDALRWQRVNKEAQQIAETLIKYAAPGFLERNLEKSGLSSRYDPDAEYTALDYRRSLPRGELGFPSSLDDVKPDLVNYNEGYADLDYLAAKYLDLPYPFSQSPDIGAEQLGKDQSTTALPSSSPERRSKGLLSRLGLRRK